MRGKSRFTKEEVVRIRELLREKIRSGNLKKYRDQLRSMGFYISNYSSYVLGGFSVEDFDRLTKSGRVTVVD